MTIKETVDMLRRHNMAEADDAAALIERLAGALEEVRQMSVWADVSVIPRINEIARRALSGEPK